MFKEITEQQSEILAFIAKRFSETGTGVGFAAICSKSEEIQKKAFLGEIIAFVARRFAETGKGVRFAEILAKCRFISVE